jgi:hypothetical protein
MMRVTNACSIGKWIIAIGLLTLPLAVSPARADDKTVTLESLLNDMSNRESIARLSEPAFVCKEASSHDRQKANPADAKTWHSNKDYGQFIRVEKNDGRDEWVIMEHEGPGAITRMWLPLLADRDKQIIRFYFDGSAIPAIAVPFNELMSGHSFVKPPLAYIAWDETDVTRELGKPGRRGVGGDLYLPIPYAKSCKITLDKLPFYYIINYRAYAAGTDVKTFTMKDYEMAAATIDRVGQQLLSTAPAGVPALNKEATLAPGAELALDLPAGSAAVQTVVVKFTSPPTPQSLRSTVLTATFDDEPAIWCPLSEFFGAGVRPHPVSDRFRSVSSDGSLTAQWVMPYQRSGRLTLKNLAKEPVSLSLGATTEAWQWDNRSLHFHANWHCQLDMPTRPMFDWNYLDVKGQGQYVGDTLTVYSPVSAWYGEGDERIYVDGEHLPSHIGTGTEDYYGYAWGMSGFFSSPFMSMPQRDSTGQNWVGYTTTSRLRVLDAIPFKSTLSHNMEIWNWADTHVDYAVGTFWYGRPGATSNREAQPQEASAPVHDVPPDPRVKRAGALECESFPIRGHSPDLAIETQDVSSISGGPWSEGKQLFVKAKKVGDYVELQIPVEGKDARKVSLFLTKSYDYGILHILVNGKPTGPDFDGFHDSAVATGPVELGTFEPSNGALILRVEVAGRNPSSKGYLFGLDCVVLGKP